MLDGQVSDAVEARKPFTCSFKAFSFLLKLLNYKKYCNTKFKINEVKLLVITGLYHLILTT